MIDGIDFFEIPAEKYWSFPSNYKGNPKTETRNLIFSDNYIGSIKRDGHYFRFIKDNDGRMSLQGRSESVNGGFLNKIGHVPQIAEQLSKLPNGTCVLGELYFPKNEGSKVVTTIMGCLEAKAIQRQEVGEKLSYYIFDIWAYNGKSLLNTKIEDRAEILDTTIFPLLGRNNFIEVAHYCQGAELWELLCGAIETNQEGIVMTLKGTHPEPGKRPKLKTLKVKKELENQLDVFFTGKFKKPNEIYDGKSIEDWQFWHNIKSETMMNGNYYLDYLNGAPIEPVTKGFFYGWAGSVEIGAYDRASNKIVRVGFLSGLVDQIKKDIVENNSWFVNKPCRVAAMEIDNESGNLRHAKFLGFRDDIDYKDCSTDKIYGS